MRSFFSGLRDVVLNVPSIFRIARSGVFQAQPYRDQYLKDHPLYRLPLLHYLLIGERRGFRPNAFFDPRHFSALSRGHGLRFYLAEQRAWAMSTSSRFDPDFYRRQDSCSWDGSCAPLSTFWERDFDLGVDPSPSFDTNFVKKACCSKAFDKRAAVFDLLSSGTNTATTEESLRQRRKDYIDGIDVQRLFGIDQPRSRDLVFVQCTSTYEASTLQENRHYDLLLNYYDASSTKNHDAEYVFSQAGTKTTAICKLLTMPSSVLLKYDQVMFLDDDVLIRSKDLSTFFELMREARIDLAQPSLSEKSSTWYADLKQPRVGKGMRPVSSVEIMMPALSRRFLSEAGWIFEEAISGWGVDLLLGLECRRKFKTLPMVIGDVVAEHLREVDEDHGSFYRFLKGLGLDASVEGGAIACKYNVDDHPISAVRYIN